MSSETLFHTHGNQLANLFVEDNMKKISFLPVVVVFIVIAAACGTSEAGNDSTVPATPTSQTSLPTTTEFEPKPGELFVPDCDDASDCAAGFVLDGRFFEVDCTAIQEELVTGEIVGSGDFAGLDVTVNVIEGVSQDELVAVSLPGGQCVEGQVPTSSWSAAYVQGRSPSHNPIICQVGLLNDDQRITNGCDTAQPSDGPSQLSEIDIAEANELMTEFLNAVFSNDPAARDFWSGYPERDADADRVFAQFLSDFEWVKQADDLSVTVVPSAGFTVTPVVTVSDNSGEIASFVLSRDDATTPLVIQRLPDVDKSRFTPSPGSEIRPGDTVTFSAVPVEGGARAFIDGNELTDVEVDLDAGTTTVVIPDTSAAFVNLTISFATPEVPGAVAISLRAS